MPRQSPWLTVQPERRASIAVASSFLEEDSNGWLVTFSDLVLQLFAFVLVAAVLGPGRTILPTVAETVTVRPPVKIPAASLARTGPEWREAPDALSLARFDELPRTATAPVAMQPVPDAGPAVRADIPLIEPMAMPVATAPAMSLAAELESFVMAEGLEEAVQVAVNGGGVTLSINDTIGFASGSIELLPDAAPVLAEVRNLVGVRADLVVEVSGHTDDRPMYAGVFHSNLDLSLARAGRVARELGAGDPELAARIFAAGYGAQRPVAPNTDAEGRARNRRVELRLVPGHDVALEPPLVREPWMAR